MGTAFRGLLPVKLCEQGLLLPEMPWNNMYTGLPTTEAHPSLGVQFLLELSHINMVDHLLGWPSSPAPPEVEVIVHDPRPPRAINHVNHIGLLINNNTLIRQDILKAYKLSTKRKVERADLSLSKINPFLHIYEYIYYVCIYIIYIFIKNIVCFHFWTSYRCFI